MACLSNRVFYNQIILYIYLYLTSGRINKTASQFTESEKDDKYACDQIRLCMKLREKYISAHPFPPQDKRYSLSMQYYIII